MREPEVGDAFGAVLHAVLAAEGRAGEVLEVVERDDGHVRVNDAARYLQPTGGPLDDWVYERVHGAVLDVGCGAGRSALVLQERGFDVLALDPSPGAAEVCRRRGVRDVLVGTVSDLPPDRRFDTSLLLGNNLGLLGGPEAGRELLADLARSSRAGASILGTGIGREPGSGAGPADERYERENVSRGRAPWQVTMRCRFGSLATEWFEYWFLPVTELEELARHTPWRVTERFEQGQAYAVRLELAG